MLKVDPLKTELLAISEKSKDLLQNGVKEKVSEIKKVEFKA